MRVLPRGLAGAGLALLLFAATGCERLFEKGAKEDLAAADKKVAAGDFRGAVAKYEGALDGTATTAEAHYKLAMLYDDKLRRPLDALHHMERYLELAPTGPNAKAAKAYQNEGETKVMTALAKGSPISQDEAARLKNENQSLQKKLIELRAQKAAPAPTLNAKGAPVQKPIPPGARTHTVQPGDTFAKISRKYYKNSTRARTIQEANFGSVEGTVTIKPGMTLRIP